MPRAAVDEEVKGNSYNNAGGSDNNAGGSYNNGGRILGQRVSRNTTVIPTMPWAVSDGKDKGDSYNNTT